MKGFAGGAMTGGRWLDKPANPVEAELRAALDQAAARAADEVALRRVWARLAETPGLVPSPENEREQAHEQFVEARARRGRWAWIVAASLAGATATLALMLIETKSEFRAERATPGRLTPRAESATTRGGPTAEEGSTLVAPATVRTGFGETLHLSLRGGTQVTVTSESTLVLDRDEHPAVSAGEVQFRVPHQAPGQTFAVSAANYRVVVVGTQFRVRVSDANAAVAVDEGVVEVWETSTDHRIARLIAGQSWVGHTAPVSLPWAMSGSDGTSKTGPEAAHPPKDVAPPARVSTRRAGSRSPAAARSSRELLALANPTSPTSPTSRFAGASSPSPSSASLSIIAPETGPVVREATVSRTAPAEAPAAVVASPAPSDKADSALLAVQARAARASGDARRALGLYRALAQRGGAAGENAEYEMGRLLRDGLHQPREAVSAWRLYRAQHPRGLLRVEADISVIETLTSLGDKVGAVAEAKDFMRRYPDSERRAEIARLAGDLLRERGECTDAIDAYDLALGSARGRKELSDAAAYHRALCLLHGDRDEGTAALRAYVSAYSDGRFRIEAQRLLDGVDSSSARQQPSTR